MKGRGRSVEMGTMAAVLFCLYIALCVMNVASRYRNSHIVNVATKPLLLPTLAVAYVLAAGHTCSPLVAGALAAGALGDTLLLADYRKHRVLFLCGMGAFMIGHLSYFIWFMSISTPVKTEIPWIIGSLGALVLSIWFWKTMAKSKHPLSKALSAYCILIDLLVVGSLTTWGSGPLLGTILCFAGSLLFCLSDLCIAMDMVQRPIGDAGTIMITYLAAQLLVVLGILVLS